VVLLVALGYVGVAFYQDTRPPVPALQGDANAPPGVATVSMIIDLMQAQLDGPGGWLPNDLILTPGYFLDNTPSFQLGVLQMVRHASRVLRDNLSRQRTSDAVNKDADLAYTAYANDPYKWAFPSAEGAYRRGDAALRRFLADLGGNAQFHPRADNLVQLLEATASELGAVTTRLLESRDPEKASWLQVDDNFYYAEGVAYAMLGLMEAVRKDFNGVLVDKNALEITGLILKSLRESQFDPWIVTNGSKSGILANHSNNLKVYLDDARQKINSLISILRQG
jgi:hypothetical protein